MNSATQLRVKELLQERQWTTKMLAEKTGMSESYLTHIKNGTRRWNEDILKRLAEAFDIEPISLFSIRQQRAAEKAEAPVLTRKIDKVQEELEEDEAVEAELPTMVPVMKEIPSQPSPYNNEIMQITTGCKGVFVPVMGYQDSDMFCIKLETAALKPRFTKGDYIIVSPAADINSGDIIAVGYGSGRETVKAFMQVQYVDTFIILESLSHKQPPVALVRGKDRYNVIGKVVMRYQKIG